MNNISDINYVYDRNENILRKEIINKINNYTKDYDIKYFSIDDIYYLLIYSKYIIEKYNLDFSKILNDNIEELLPYLQDKCRSYIRKGILNKYIEYKIYHLIKFVIYREYTFEVYKDRVIDLYIDTNKRYLLVSNVAVPYINHSNVDIYYEKGILLNGLVAPSIYEYSIKDEIIGINRECYNNLKDIDFTKYDTIIVLNDTKEPYDIIKEYKKIFRKCKVLLKCKYSDISKYRTTFDDFRYKDQSSNINTILLDKSLAYLLYNYTNKDTKINIKELSNIEDKDLSNIINTKDSIDNVSIYVNVDDIINNRYRIGFSYYNSNNINDNTTKDIIKLVDYNEYLTNRIKELNDEISKKLDEMFIK